MSLIDRLRRWFCRDCLPDERRHPAIAALERASTRLDRLSALVRQVHDEMADDDNPVLGPPPRAPRKEPT